MNWNSIAGIASTTALFIPVAIILILKLYKNISLVTLLFYNLFSAVYNLMTQGFIPVPDSVATVTGTINNFLDAPMMLVVLCFFCNEKWMQKTIYWSILLFFIYECFIITYFRFRFESSTYLLGPDILIIVLYSTYLFFHYGKRSVIHGKGIGMTIMLVGITFSYGCFAIIYILHYIVQTPAVNDVFLIYYIVTIISALLIGVGLLWIYKRNKEIAEVQMTRKELAWFFNT
jgi:hypothetical protein